MRVDGRKDRNSEMEEDGKEEDFIIGIDKEEGGKITSHRE